MSDELPPPQNLIVWFRPLGKPLPCLELDAWPWTWCRELGWTPIGEAGPRAALEVLKAKILRRSSRHAGEYAVTPDDVVFPPADVDTPWPVVVLKPRPPKPKRPLSAKQQEKRAAAFARVDGSTNLASRTPQPDTSTTDSPPHEMP